MTFFKKQVESECGMCAINHLIGEEVVVRANEHENCKVVTKGGKQYVNLLGVCKSMPTTTKAINSHCQKGGNWISDDVIMKVMCMVFENLFARTLSTVPNRGEQVRSVLNRLCDVTRHMSAARVPGGYLVQRGGAKGLTHWLAIKNGLVYDSQYEGPMDAEEYDETMQPAVRAVWQNEPVTYTLFIGTRREQLVEISKYRDSSMLDIEVTVHAMVPFKAAHEERWNLLKCLLRSGNRVFIRHSQKPFLDSLVIKRPQETTTQSGDGYYFIINVYDGYDEYHMYEGKTRVDVTVV